MSSSKEAWKMEKYHWVWNAYNVMLIIFYLVLLWLIIQYHKNVEKFQVWSSKEAWWMEKYHWVWNAYMSCWLIFI